MILYCFISTALVVVLWARCRRYKDDAQYNRIMAKHFKVMYDGLLSRHLENEVAKQDAKTSTNELP